MADRYIKIEKGFIFLLVLSVLFHLAVFELVSLIPPEKTKSAPEPTMVELTDLPRLPPEPAPKPKPQPQPQPRPNLRHDQPLSKPVYRYAEKRQRVEREMAPKAEVEAPRLTRRPQPTPPSRAQMRPQQDTTINQQAGVTSAPQDKGGAAPLPRGAGLFKPKTGDASDRTRLFPSAGKLARLEENYRQKYGSEVVAGDTSFLNTDDIQFGSFLRRLETAVYGTWHYPEAALRRGIEGTTPVRITFNRNGEIVRVELLETSGSSILDEEVMRTLKSLGPIGSLPKAYGGDVFKVIAFFHYGIGGSWLR